MALEIERSDSWPDSHQRGPVINFRDGLKGKSTSCSSRSQLHGQPRQTKVCCPSKLLRNNGVPSSTNTPGHLQNSCTEQRAQPAPVESTDNETEQAVNYGVFQENITICRTFSCPKQLKRQLLIVDEFRLPLQSSGHIKLWLPPVSLHTT